MAIDSTTTAGRLQPPSRERRRPESTPATLDLSADGTTLRVLVRGDWHGATRLPQGEAPQPIPARVERVEIALDSDARADVRVLARVRALLSRPELQDAKIELGHLPEGMRGLLELSLAQRAQRPAAEAQSESTLLDRVGVRMLAFLERLRQLLVFIGETVIGIGAFVTGRARFRRIDFWIVVQDVGARALPIVSIVAFMFGAVLAFIGSLQLRPFGAQVFVANLVGSGMALEMGALITGVVMAGRAGAAFAAQIGTMQVNEEVDALNAMGLRPMEFLVVPRILALGLMSPLLALYADAVGIVGGMVVGVTMLDLSSAAYWTQMLQFLEADQFVKGLVKSFTYGILIAISGCLRGMQCGRSAQAVGEATTSAVVTSIVAIVVADTIITVLIFELDL